MLSSASFVWDHQLFLLLSKFFPSLSRSKKKTTRFAAYQIGHWIAYRLAKSSSCCCCLHGICWNGSRKHKPWFLNRESLILPSPPPDRFHLHDSRRLIRCWLWSGLSITIGDLARPCQQHRLSRVRKICHFRTCASANVACSWARFQARTFRLGSFGVAGYFHQRSSSRCLCSSDREGLFVAKGRELRLRDIAGRDFKDRWPAIPNGISGSKLVWNGDSYPRHLFYTRARQRGTLFSQEGLRFRVSSCRLLPDPKHVLQTLITSFSFREFQNSGTSSSIPKTSFPFEKP